MNLHAGSVEAGHGPFPEESYSIRELHTRAARRLGAIERVFEELKIPRISRGEDFQFAGRMQGAARNAHRVNRLPICITEPEPQTKAKAAKFSKPKVATAGGYDAHVVVYDEIMLARSARSAPGGVNLPTAPVVSRRAKGRYCTW